jgi:hypothetical protein
MLRKGVNSEHGDFLDLGTMLEHGPQSWTSPTHLTARHGLIHYAGMAELPNPIATRSRAIRAEGAVFSCTIDSGSEQVGKVAG